MRSEERERIRKRHDELPHNRKNTQDRRNVSSDVRPQHSRSNNRVEMHESSRYKKDERRKPQFSSVATKRSNERTRRDTSLIGQHDRVHRNSPVELVYRGCRNTDSPSSSSGEENEDHNVCQKKSGGSQSRKRRHYEESVKELSARKKQIESELRALDEEEAAEAEKKKFRNSSNHQQHQERHMEERTVRIKQDSGNNNERTNNRSKRIEQPKRLVRVKQERLSDEDKRNGVRPRKNHKKTHPPLHIKQERDHSSPSRRHRAHHSNDNGRRRNVTSDSRDITNMEWGKSSSSEKGEKNEVKEKEKPNFETSGKLAEDTNTYNGVVIKYSEPSEARKPRRKWRLYPFKGDSSLPFIPVHRQSAYLLGRSRLIADIPIDHPSCSKQHAVLQFRLTPYVRENGTKGRSVRPYIIDLDSSNGTFINNKRIEPRRYMELLEKDVLKFGFSSRVYVILHEDSKNDDDDEADD